jgi:uncharacterized protein
MNPDALRRQLQQAGHLALTVKVTPRAPKTEFAGEMSDGTLKIKLAAVPDKGKANAELCAFLQHQLGAARAVVVSGQTSQRKLVRLYSTIDRVP